MGKNTEDRYEKVKRYIAKYRMISEGDVIAAGVSGGADSVCLLVMLWKLSEEMSFRLLAVHVNHGVRADADQDADYVERLCGRLGIPFFLKKVDMEEYAARRKLSPEEAGRQLRYQAFEEILESMRESALPEMQNKNRYKIAVAHSQNDRAETMLFHLFRGSGLKGLGSIRPVRGQIIRPLLCLDRTQIEAYLAQEEIDFCIDSTNDEDTYTRNRIRHNIIPYAETKICKNVVAHINAAADIITSTEAFIERQTFLAYKRVTKRSENVLILDIKAFRQEDAYLQKMILLYCLEVMAGHRKDITREHINALLVILSKDGSKELSLPYGLCAYKEYDMLTIRRRMKKEARFPKDQETVSFPVPVPGKTEVPESGVWEFRIIDQEEYQNLQKKEDFSGKDQINSEKTYTKWFDYDKITTDLLIRTRKTGDYISIDNAAFHKKSVKDYMINEKIPKIQREHIYLLADGAHILWIPDYRISQYYKVDKNTNCILQVQLRGGR